MLSSTRFFSQPRRSLCSSAFRFQLIEKLIQTNVVMRRFELQWLWPNANPLGRFPFFDLFIPQQPSDQSPLGTSSPTRSGRTCWSQHTASWSRFGEGTRLRTERQTFQKRDKILCLAFASIRQTNSTRRVRPAIVIFRTQPAKRSNSLLEMCSASPKKFVCIHAVTCTKIL